MYTKVVAARVRRVAGIEAAAWIATTAGLRQRIYAIPTVSSTFVMSVSPILPPNGPTRKNMPVRQA